MGKKYITLKHGARPAGFALVATLSIIALLVILVMGLLSLSQSSLRRNTQDKAHAEAQANARLSLALAIGALQKHAGPDARITAPADIVNVENPPLVGVWRSWQGSDNQPTGILKERPITPDYPSKTKAVSQNGRSRQADILRPIAPIPSARDDTFPIRAYGESTDAAGKVLARAWCEVTLQHSRDFLDPADEPDITTQPSVPANQIFGRRFKVVSFRWLNANEV